MASLNDIATITTNLEKSKLDLSGGTLNGPIVMSGSNTITISYNYGIKGTKSDGSNDYIMYVDTSNNLHIGYASNFPVYCDGDLTAKKVFNAVWNDYAEYFERGEQTEPGDICCLDTNSKVEQYVKADCNSLRVIGVHSDTYGHIVGGEEIKEGNFTIENDKKFIPIGLVGRVRVKFTGKSKIGDYVVPSEIKGVGRAYRDGDDKNNIIGYLVESDDLDNQTRRLKIMIQRGVV